jgi:sialate O-acetylesterase
VVWLRKVVDLDADTAAKAITLHHVVDDNDVTWVNGVKVGATDGYNVPRAYKVPSGVFHAGKNVIVVRVTDTQSPGGIWGDPAGIALEVSGGPSIPLAGDWKLKLGAAVTAKNPLPLLVQNNPNLPTVLYNGMIQPIIPFGVKGAIWYQGESNAGQALQYRTLLPTMIESWHKNWGEGQFPFHIVQLAGFMAPPANPGDDAWAELREAQWMTAKHVRNAGLATAIDIGEQNDIHPKNKQEVGRRLALVAEAQDYHMKVASSGPTYASMEVQNATIRLAFDHLEGGLVAKGGPLKGFAIAGSDHKWYWADARIEGDAVVVSSSSVPNPVAVRYSWAAFLDSNLYNQAGLPALPFRTDTWKGITK